MICAGLTDSSLQPQHPAGLAKVVAIKIERVTASGKRVGRRKNVQSSKRQYWKRS
jgi:hypothetical protein